ncbi:MAG: hypothetical protein R3E96_09060 [Planctomycetota bacterium]
MPTSADIARLDPDAKALLLKILERYAYRQRMVVNVMGHGESTCPGSTTSGVSWRSWATPSRCSLRSSACTEPSAVSN